MSNDNMDLGVPARVADGWRYVVSLEEGSVGKLHATIPIAKIRELYQDARKAGHSTLTFDGAKWLLDDSGADCAGFVDPARVLAIGYATPADQLAIDAAIRELDRMASDAEDAKNGTQPGQSGAENGGGDAGDAALRSLGQGWPETAPPG